MSTTLLKIGMREFRDNMQKFMNLASPIAITRHGETVGFYIPSHQPQKSDLDELKKAASILDKLLISSGLTEEELLSEFRSRK